MKKIVENILNNDNISERSKELLAEDFEKMFELLDKKGFLQYVKFQELASNAKSLIVSELEDDNPIFTYCSGQYNNALNKISLRKSDFSIKKKISEISTHESYHFFSRGNQLSVYLEEGITQLLTVLTHGIEDNSSYIENTQFAAFLLSFMGDSIIKSYFTHNSKYFEKDLHDLLTEEITDEDTIDNKIYNFFELLNSRHRKTYERMPAEEFEEYTECDKKILDEFQEIKELNDFVDTLIRCKIKKMARNRIFNKNGSLDENIVKKVLTEKLKYYIPFEEIDFLLYADNSIIENEEEELKTYIDEYAPIIQLNCNSKIKCKSKVAQVKHYHDNYNLSTEKIFKEWISEFITKNHLSAIDFSDYIVNLASEFNIPKAELDTLCEKYAFDSLQSRNIVNNTQKDADFSNFYEVSPQDVYDVISADIPRNKAVFDLLANEITRTEPKFRKIGDSEYVKQHEDQFIYLKINDDGTIYEEPDLAKVKDIFKINDTLESIRLINAEDDYKDLGILNEQQFQEVELVHSITKQILTQDDIDLENAVKRMNCIISDTGFLDNLTQATLQKRTRLQVMDLINVLTKDEIKEISDQIYDKALLESGIDTRKALTEIEKSQDDVYEYEINNR